ncbi:cation efflux system protein [Alcanivorax hongdengensis A-11-3]|uniref:Cation efflux system protein n=1 Tax=Alcanivorax hongdengensis A-11-3 TaxID=1177179 RepID=L0WF31_9GAMM|nr:TolC family protein [Alcanivorax hongdengensis]EKF74395.1 cation efflux system protein [Alcanivorax hongdengensis A-11-3]
MESKTVVRTSALLAVLLCAPGVQAAGNEWARWVQRQVSALPASAAINAARDQARAQTEAASQPLYNPALNIGYEDSADITRTVGLSQTLDWSGKARAARDSATLRMDLVDNQAGQARARLLADALDALVRFDAAGARLAAARQQEQQLTDLTDLIRRREQAGDLGQVDAQLAYLSLAQAQQKLADAEAQSTAATTALQQGLAVARPARALPAVDRWLAEPAPVDSRLPHSYALQRADLRQQLAERQVTLADKARNSDPSLGLRLGKEGDDRLWGVDLSVPLKVFNTGKADYRAALASQDQRQAQLAKTRNDARAALQGARQTYLQRRHRWQTWQRLTGDSLAGSDDLLERVWRQGELTTQDYLQALNQRLETRLSGIALCEAMQQAWLQWLYQSAQLDDWLNDFR